MKLDTYVTPYTKVNSKWINKLNIRPETNLLEKKKIGEKLHDIGLDKDFMDMTPKAKAKRKKLKTENIKLNGTTTK